MLPYSAEFLRVLLKDKWEKPQTTEREDIDFILQGFPYSQTPDGENLNLFAVDIFRAHPDKVDLKGFARKLD